MSTTHIPIDRLRGVKTVVSHANCPDGIASAVLLADALPGAKVQFVQNQLDHIDARPGQLWVDCCPPAERAKEFDDAGVIVLDHHRSAEATVRSFRYHAFADEQTEPGVSGAMLAFRRVWDPLYIGARRRDIAHRFARLAGIRDTWVRADPDWETACAQAEALVFYPLSYWIDREKPWPFFNSNYAGLLEDRRAVGAIARKKNLDSAKRRAAAARRAQLTFGTDQDPLTYAVVPTRSTTDIGDIMCGPEGGVDLLIGFNYIWHEDRPKLRLSLRGAGRFNCYRFCQQLGGGGHSNAAGCTVEASRCRDPYSHIDDLLVEYQKDTPWAPIATTKSTPTPPRP